MPRGPERLQNRRPMSDRRFVVLMIALLAVPVGAAVAIVALIALREPLVRGGEIGARRDLTPELVAATGVGLVLLLAGLVVAGRLLRRPR